MVDFDQRALGNLEAQVQSLSLAVSLLSGRLDRNSEKLDAIDVTLSEARGGWRVLMWVGGAGGAFGALAAHIAQTLVGKTGS